MTPETSLLYFRLMTWRQPRRKLSPQAEFCQRLDRALMRRRGGYIEGMAAVCEVCGDKMRHYTGPCPGVVCARCLGFSGESQCTRITPLVNLRATIEEKGKPMGWS